MTTKITLIAATTAILLAGILTGREGVTIFAGIIFAIVVLDSL